MPPQTGFNASEIIDVIKPVEQNNKGIAHSNQEGASYFGALRKDDTANLHAFALVDGGSTVAGGGMHDLIGTGLRPPEAGQSSGPAETPVNPLGEGGLHKTNFDPTTEPLDGPRNYGAPREPLAGPLTRGGYDPTNEPLDGPRNYGEPREPLAGPLTRGGYDPTTEPLDGPRNYGEPQRPADGPTYRPDGSTAQTEGDGSTVLTKPDQSTVHADKNGNVTEVDRADGTKTKFTYDSKNQISGMSETDSTGQQYFDGPVNPGSVKVDNDGTVHEYGINKGGTETYEASTKYTDGTRVDKAEDGTVTMIVSQGDVVYNSHDKSAPPTTAHTWNDGDGNSMVENPDGSKVFTEKNGTVVDISKNGEVNFRGAAGEQTPGDSLESNGDPQVKTLTGDVPVPSGLG
ncbi:MAG TPA: hypothetical protein V6C81_28295 [Planktothrix sp.]